MLFKCLPPGAPIPGRFPGPAHARGKWFTVDIHCHVLTPKAAEMVAGNAAATRHPREVYANERTREVNRQQAERNRIQFTSVEKRLADMDRMGIDIQAISPSPNQTYYGADPDLGIATARVVNDNLAEIVGRHPDRFVPLGTVPFQAPDLAVAELDRLHKSLGFRGIEIATNVGRRGSLGRALPQDLRAGRGTRPADLHAPDRVSRGAAVRRPLPCQCDRQPARLDRRGPSSDLWRRAARPPQPEARRGAWRRLSAGLFRPHRPRGRGPPRLLRSRSTGCRPTYLKRLYFDTIVFTHHQLEYLVDQYGADHVLMGTDYPADMGEVDPIGFVEGAAGLDDAERRAILGRNAARLLNIEIPAASG